ncbi:unnamed protein product [Vitrella brassicaformis CCMP3155]|uniref:RING-type domain-containing protein n=1 Tax=Vitrella brassicaformis (strain CCMP3155) TaxID=1169540 RepID=A0A0G4GPQ0_VITBC|nr:unnamed protein product [Vitrella brassicaformis CCMP3155]|mmetsp:Transcript_51377/g.129033  ORF Transcript_51377/g.129033 Transcript_51377/m.129033 type:complete len:234 (-) Transcript_51377:2565-3266(-)|eukprot:CEM32341.1 unnamed protein product [Vitrella brassicaformis CCMP3155]
MRRRSRSRGRRDASFPPRHDTGDSDALEVADVRGRQLRALKHRKKPSGDAEGADGEKQAKGGEREGSIKGGKGDSVGDDGQGGGEGELCSVCQQTLSVCDVGSLACAHSFCYRCILSWARRGTTQCPVCRATFDKIIRHTRNMHKMQLRPRQAPAPASASAAASTSASASAASASVAASAAASGGGGQQQQQSSEWVEQVVCVAQRLPAPPPLPNPMLMGFIEALNQQALNQH